VSRTRPSVLAAADEDEPTVYSIAAALDEASGGSTFVRGLALGALVGAAIAGSLIRMRIRRRRRRPHQLSRSGARELEANVTDRPTLLGDAAPNQPNQPDPTDQPNQPSPPEQPEGDEPSSATPTA
jgi:hypothetical protein